MRDFGGCIILSLSNAGPDMAANRVFTTVSANGRVVLPKAIRDQMHWDAGTRLVVKRTVDGVLLQSVTAPFAPTRPEDVFGCLLSGSGQRSVEEMSEGIVAEAKRRYMRST